MKLCNKNRKYSFSFGEVAWEGNGGALRLGWHWKKETKNGEEWYNMHLMIGDHNVPHARQTYPLDAKINYRTEGHFTEFGQIANPKKWLLHILRRIMDLMECSSLNHKYANFSYVYF